MYASCIYTVSVLIVALFAPTHHMNFLFHFNPSEIHYSPCVSRPVNLFPAINQENNTPDSQPLVAPTTKPSHDDNGIPPEFNPRGALNMPLAEKVSSWLRCVPWTELRDGVWVTDCYPGHPLSTECSDDLKSAPDDQDQLEQQARQITKIITENYLNNGEPSVRPFTDSSGLSERYSDDGYLYGYAEINFDEEHNYAS